MFDKNLFDRNAFDRSVSSDGISQSFLGSSKVELNVTIVSPVPVKVFSGDGGLSLKIRMRQQLDHAFYGIGDISDTSVILKRATSAPLSGGGTLIPNFVIKTPINARITGAGSTTLSDRMLIHQNIKPVLYGSGAFLSSPIFGTSISGVKTSGEASFIGRIALQLPLTMKLAGASEMSLRRVGALNENVIELLGINLLPGESVTIDTDLLQVLFGAREDVSAVTTDSVFFELNPGQNDIMISTDIDGPLDVTAVWHNRWL